ncbi:MAG: hypothetical protein [Mu-like cryoconite phage AB09]|nr:MAG: hypothetical protein [Mu-like cryoconite phage AB09]
MAQTAQEVFTHGLVSGATRALIVFSNDAGGIGVSWSDMPVEDLCYLSQVLTHAVQSKVAQGFASPARVESAPVAEPKAEPKAAKVVKKTTAVNNFPRSNQ